MRRVLLPLALLLGAAAVVTAETRTSRWGEERHAPRAAEHTFDGMIDCLVDRSTAPGPIKELCKRRAHPPKSLPFHTRLPPHRSAAVAATKGEGGASRLSVLGAGGDDEGDALVKLLSEHWEDLFDASEGSEEGASVLDASELVARIEEGKKNRAKRCVGDIRL